MSFFFVSKPTISDPPPKTLRSTCAGTGALVGEFNGMMQALRGTFAARGAQVAPLQTALVEGGVLPISSAENAASTLSPDAAATFFSDDEPAAAPAVAAPTATDDPDDLVCCAWAVQAAERACQLIPLPFPHSPQTAGRAVG